MTIRKNGKKGLIIVIFIEEKVGIFFSHSSPDVLFMGLPISLLLGMGGQYNNISVNCGKYMYM